MFQRSIYCSISTSALDMLRVVGYSFLCSSSIAQLGACKISRCVLPRLIRSVHMIDASSPLNVSAFSCLSGFSRKFTFAEIRQLSQLVRITKSFKSNATSQAHNIYSISEWLCRWKVAKNQMTFQASFKCPPSSITELATARGR